MFINWHIKRANQYFVMCPCLPAPSRSCLTSNRSASWSARWACTWVTNIILIASIILGGKEVTGPSFFSLNFMRTQQFSLGLRSGDFPWQSIWNPEFLLHLLQLPADYFRLEAVAQSTALQEPGASVNSHEWQQVVLQDLLVPLAVRGGVFREEVQAASAAAKTPPTHHTG